MKSYLKWGDWNAICQVCGFKYKASQLKKRWDGLMVCNEDYELRHPQDLIRQPKENTSVPWTSPEKADVFTDGSDGTAVVFDPACTYDSINGGADRYEADCMQAFAG